MASANLYESVMGRMQNGAADAIVADTYDPDTQQLGGEPYIIGRAEFRQTYRLDTSGDNLSRFAGRFGRFASNDGSGQLTLSERAVEQQIVDVMQLNPADVLRVERILADRLGTLEQLGAESEQIARVTHAVNLLRQQMASDVRFLDAAKNV